MMIPTNFVTDISELKEKFRRYYLKELKKYIENSSYPILGINARNINFSHIQIEPFLNDANNLEIASTFVCSYKGYYSSRVRKSIIITRTILTFSFNDGKDIIWRFRPLNTLDDINAQHLKNYQDIKNCLYSWLIYQRFCKKYNQSKNQISSSSFYPGSWYYLKYHIFESNFPLIEFLKLTLKKISYIQARYTKNLTHGIRSIREEEKNNYTHFDILPRYISLLIDELKNLKSSKDILTFNLYEFTKDFEINLIHEKNN